MIFCLLFSAVCQTKAQENQALPKEIILKELGIEFTPIKAPSELEFYTGEDSIKIFLKDIRGGLDFRYFNKANQDLITGHYKPGCGDLKRQINSYLFELDSEKMELEDYYQPLKDSDWYYYYPDGPKHEFYTCNCIDDSIAQDKILPILIFDYCDKAWDFDTVFMPMTIPDTFKIYINENVVISGIVKNYAGDMSIEINDRQSGTKMIGNYIPGFGVLSKYQGNALNCDVRVIRYLQPLKNGVFRYYRNDKEFKKAEYHLGVRKFK